MLTVEADWRDLPTRQRTLGSAGNISTQERGGVTFSPGCSESKHSQHLDLGPLASPTVRGKCLLVLVCGSGLSEHRLPLNLERALLLMRNLGHRNHVKSLKF